VKRKIRPGQVKSALALRVGADRRPRLSLTLPWAARLGTEAPFGLRHTDLDE
jgi:hypothetical protein